MRKIKVVAIVSMCFVAAVALGVALALPVLADGVFDSTWITKKALISNLYKCYNGHMESPITLPDGNNPGNYPSGSAAGLAKSDNQAIAALPTDFYGNVSTITCQELLGGKGSYGGIASYAGAFPGLHSSTEAAQTKYLEKLGYKASISNSSTFEQCGRFTYTVAHYTGYKENRVVDAFDNVNYSDYRTPELCSTNIDQDGNLTSALITLGGSSEGLADGYVEPINFGIDRTGVGFAAAGGGSATIQCQVGENFEKSCLKRIHDSLPSEIVVQDTDYPISMSYMQYSLQADFTVTGEPTKIAKEYKLDNDSAKTAANNLFGSTTSTFVPAEKVSLYQIYLNHDAEAMYCSVPADKKDTLVSSGYRDKAVNLVVNGKSYSNCYVKINDKTYNGFDGAEWFKEVSVDEILDFLASTTVSDTWANDVISANAIIYGEEPEDENIATDQVEGDDVNCFNSAGALGWIICPIISFVQDTITAIYDSIITNFLTFNADNIQIGGNVYKAWQTFQSIANIAFVIVLLIVIFSQVTGFGIDNLGIKRVLPKLIVAAILINLSFIICQIAVDISNILGVGLNTMFANISVTAQTSGGGTASAVLSTIMTTAVGGAVGALAVGTVGIWGAVIIIPLLLGLVTTLFGILFFFVILGARQALIIIMIVLSPVAFACYMLPNTKSIFDRWLKAFEALLLVFPICGLLMGGSAFASDVLMTLDTGFLGKLIAMLVGVVPFFFIPTLLRGSMSALGNIGARISGFGNNMSRRITGAAANSDTVRDAQARARAGIDMNGNPTRLAQWRQNIAQGNSRLSRIPGLGGIMQRASYRANARSNAARVKYLDERRREERLNDPGFFEQYERSQQMALDKEELNTAIDNVNYNTDKGENQSELFKIYDNALASGDVTRMRAVAEIAGRRKDTANAFIQKFKDDSEQGRYAGKDDMIQKVAKQIATGDNSKNYRASNAMGFEYVSQITQGNTAAREANGGIMSYDKWKNNAENVHSALDHHITNGSELYGQSNASLRELNDLATNHMAKGKNANGEEIDIEHNDKEYLGRLAQRAEREGAEMGGAYDESKTNMINTLKSNAPVINQNDAQPGQSFNIQTNQANRATDDELRELMGELNTKVDNRTATREDWETLQKIQNEFNVRKAERNQRIQETLDSRQQQRNNPQ